MAYYEVCLAYRADNWRTRVDEKGYPYAFKEDQWVGYESPDSIAEKVF